MNRSQRRADHQPGEAPGTIRVDPSAPPPVVRAVGYGPDGFAERVVGTAAEVSEFVGAWPVTWINVDGLGDAELLVGLGEVFGLHRLALEDVAHARQRAKVEAYDDHLFIVARMPSPEGKFVTEQLTLFLGPNYVVTFQERSGHCLAPVRERIRKGRGRVRGAGADYLAYALLDAVTDAYFPVLEEFGEHLELLEDDIFEQPDQEHIPEIHELKRELLRLRRSLWPLREAVSVLQRNDTPLIADATRLYLRDCYDHLAQLLEFVETDRDIAAGLMDFYLSSVSRRMNEVMKVLTIIATVFIPLTFIAGVYGMNFDTGASPWNMPELTWRWGYPACMATMAALAVVLLAVFRRAGWIGARRSRKQGRDSS